MTKRRHMSCPHCEAEGIRKPLLRHAGYKAPEGAESSLVELAAALNDLPDTLPSGTVSITESDVSSLLEAAPLGVRKLALEHLGLRMTPRTISQSLCRDVRHRFANGQRTDVLHSLGGLTAPVVDAILCSSASPDAPLPGPVWSPAVLSMVLWTRVSASAEGARILLWAAEETWWPGGGIRAEDAKRVLEAAGRVVEATPDFVHRVNRVPSSTNRTGELSNRDDDRQGALIEAGSEEHSEPMSESRSARSLEHLQAERVDLERLHMEAILVVGAMERALADGQRLPLDGVSALAAYDAAFERLAHALAASDDEAPQCLTHMDDELNRRVTLQDEVRRLRLLLDLTQLGGITAEQIGTMHTLVHVALDSGSDERTYDALLALVDLVESTSSTEERDPARLIALQNRIQRGLPSELGGIPMAVILRPVPQVETAYVSPPTQETVRGKSAVEPLTPAAPTISVPSPANGARADEIASSGRFEQLSVPADPPVPETQESLAEPPTVGEHPGASYENENQNAEVARTVAALVAERRFSLAAAIVDAAGAGQTGPLRIAALAAALRSGTGPCAARLRDELTDVDTEALTSDTPTLLLTVPALIRTALLTGESTAGALLGHAAPHLEPSLSAIAGAIGQRALKGVLSGNPLGAVLADVSQNEERLERARQGARDQLACPPRLKFRRATKLAETWFGQKGLVGSLLVAVVNDDRSQTETVTARMIELSRKEHLHKEVDRADAALRGSSRRPLQGVARNNLVTHVEAALAIVSSWLDVVSAEKQSGDHETAWAIADLAEMREVVRSHAPKAFAELESRASGESLVGAVHAAAAGTLRSVVDILEGATDTVVGEPMPDHVLTVELLKIPHATVDTVTERVRPPVETGTGELLDAAGTGWAEAFEAQVRAERYPTARHLLDLAEAGRLAGGGDPLPDSARKDLEAAERRSHEELTALRATLTTTLNRARLQQEVSEEQEGELASLLNVDMYTPDTDPADVRSRLVAAEELLPQYREEAARKLLDRLDRLVSHPTRAKVDAEHIRALIGEGRLTTAEELIYFCEIGEPVPDSEEEERPVFFPDVPDCLSEGITPKLIGIARSGGVVPDCPSLDFGRLSADTRGFVAETLTSWMEKRDVPVKGRYQTGNREVLSQALRLIGYDVPFSGGMSELAQAKGRDRRFFEFAGVTWNGNPVVPQFGSKLHNRLRVLFCWSQPSAELLMNWVNQDTSGGAVLVVHLGTMSARVRRRLAVHAVQSETPVAVLDDAALVYLAANGDRQPDTAMAVLLPFSSVQPYARNKRSLVPPEMFYGRDAERKAVLDPEGTQVIFGGRGLGKSALLRDAKTAFEREAERVALHIELTTVAIGHGRQGADAIWDVLLRELRYAGVVPSPKGRTRADAYETVRAGVLDWLAADSRRRLLLLLDESDGFFEADAPRFLETNRLKGLGQLAGVEGRAKAVFAGLHSVQRFAKLSNNTFKHLAQKPTPIGPLRPQFAHDLIERPTRTLGFAFEEKELIHRILGYCSYQPFLLQIFGHRLVGHMHDKRRSGIGPEEPPYLITRDDVESVESDPGLQEEITSTFRDTLNLDPRYNIIANVLAHHAYERGMDVRLTELELREECLTYWGEGFSSLDSEAFRAYLSEMVGLGLLASNPDQRGWRLRSANVLRMIGTPDQVQTELLDADAASVPAKSIALAMRRHLPDGRRAPLTAAQVDDLLGDHTNQVRVVFGSRATGIDDVADTLRAVRHDLGGRYDLQEPQDRRRFEEALLQGQPGQRRIVFSDLAAATPRSETCRLSLDAALTHRPTDRGVTRAVVLVSAPEQMAFWQEVLSGREHEGLGVVRLRRHDRLSLRVWALDTDSFTSAEHQEQLLRVTGGWPILVEQAHAIAVTSTEKRALQKLEENLTRADGAAAFLDEVGLTADLELAGAFDGLVRLVGIDQVPHSDLVDAVELSGQHSDPEAAVACLDALGVFDREGDTYGVEPLVAGAWTHRRM